MDRLTRYPNVHWLGYRQYAEIPGLGADFDVAIMPWLDNDWIAHCNPIKLKEYLALGLETVTTYFPEVEYFRDYVHVARSHDEFLQKIDAVVAGERRPGDRDALLAHASWDDRTEDLLSLLDGLHEKNPQKVEEPACAVS
jgi:alpha-L-fucosidase